MVFFFAIEKILQRDHEQKASAKAHYFSVNRLHGVLVFFWLEQGNADGADGVYPGGNADDGNGEHEAHTKYGNDHAPG